MSESGSKDGLAVFVALFFVLLGALTFCMGLVHCSGTQAFLQRATARVEGHVAGTQVEHSGDTTTTIALIRYRTEPNAAWHSVKVEEQFWLGDSFSTSDKVPVIYDPSNPGSARVDSVGQIWGATILFMGGGPLLILVMVGLLRGTWKELGTDAAARSKRRRVFGIPAAVYLLLFFLVFGLWFREHLRTSPARVPELIEVLNGSDESAKESACRTLYDIGPEAKSAAPALVEHMLARGGKGFASTAIGKVDPQWEAATDHLVALLNGEDAELREQALSQLRLRLERRLKGDRGALNGVIARFLDPEAKTDRGELLVVLRVTLLGRLRFADTTLRRSAPKDKALASLENDGGRILSAFVQTLGTSDPKLRQDVAAALTESAVMAASTLSLHSSGSFRTPEEVAGLIQILQEALASEERMVKALGLFGLACLGADNAPATDALVAAKEGKDPVLASLAARAVEAGACGVQTWSLSGR